MKVDMFIAWLLDIDESLIPIIMGTRFTRSTTYGSNYEWYTLYNGTDHSNLIFDEPPLEDYSYHMFGLMLSPGQYTIILHDQMGDGWALGSVLFIYTPSRVYILRLAEGYSEAIDIIVYSVFKKQLGKLKVSSVPCPQECSREISHL